MLQHTQKKKNRLVEISIFIVFFDVVVAGCCCHCDTIFPLHVLDDDFREFHFSFKTTHKKVNVIQFSFFFLE